MAPSSVAESPAEVAIFESALASLNGNFYQPMFRMVMVILIIPMKMGEDGNPMEIL